MKSSCSRAGLAVDATASAREARAGRVVPVSPRLCADDGAVRLRLARKFPAPSTGPGILRRHGGPCVRQNRVVLAVVATVKLFEDVREPNRVDGIVNLNSEGGQRNGRLPGDHGISRATTAQGRPRDRPHLYAAVRFFPRASFAQQTAGASRHPAFPVPSWIGGWRDQAKLGWIKPRERKSASASEMQRREQCRCVGLRHCERSEAIQSLSGETVWIASLRCACNDGVGAAAGRWRCETPARND